MTDIALDTLKDSTISAQDFERAKAEKTVLTQYVEYLQDVNDAGLDLPQVEIAFENLSYEVTVPRVNTKLPGMLSAYRENLKDIWKFFRGVKASKYTQLQVLNNCTGVLRPEIGRAVQQECRDRSRMPSSA
eukprot:TRINITY_DN19292_c1_g1_i2.p1 TRINITY_DN19292_c1_g1~~TRINITY_DN19292_c1_g1_i2.p1  ORF type:complete len:142 (-),score=28.27 TRINITY_DN19292_c1_g1_i2:11-403(-)